MNKKKLKSFEITLKLNVSVPIEMEPALRTANVSIKVERSAEIALRGDKQNSNIF